MRIQTRLFLGTALLVLTLMAGQWWLHIRQLRAIEHELGSVAAMVGKDLLSHHVAMIAAPGEAIGAEGFTRVWVTAEGEEGVAAPTEVIGDDGELIHDVHVVAVPDGTSNGVERRVERILRIDEDGTTEETVEHFMTLDLDALAAGDVGHTEIQTDVSTATGTDESAAADHGEARTVREVELRVVSRRSPTERFLVVRDGAGERRIQIPVSPTQQIVRSTLEKSLLMSGGLLLLGLAGSGVLASRMTRPLRQLAETSEAVGRGELGVQVEETAAGEVGELQRSFNRMSTRLAELESERESWRRREHLAQLGDLSRGLAHTVRNPLNTLGLAVEELARDDAGQTHLVTTARQQIRRIDRWLRSFLALGASDAAVAERTDLGALAEEVVLESIQEGVTVRFEKAEEPIHVSCVPTALRAALANLLENAAEASHGDESVDVSLRRDGSDAVLTVADRGPGLPDEVRHRLYSPHVTTKVEGSGMGLFLARQLVVGMHDGRLAVTDRDGGGTEAEVRIPIAEVDD
jgi:signal transduction histidine kinase